MPFHTEYADGCPRPLLRGWLHGVATLTVVPYVLTNLSNIPQPALPTVLSICCGFILSCLMHLVPWKSVAMMEAITKIDKCAIIAVAGLTFWAPQLLQSDSAGLCKPDYLFSVGTVAIPTTLSALGIICGLGPIVFAGGAFAGLSQIGFYGMWSQIHDTEFIYYLTACLMLNGTGLSLYAKKVGGHKKYWGYHEWMHVLVAIGTVMNVKALFVMSDLTNEMCRPDLYNMAAGLNHNPLAIESLSTTTEVFSAMNATSSLCFTNHSMGYVV